MLFDLNRRLGVVLGSVVTLVTGLAVLVNEFAGAVVTSLPDGWQDNAARIALGVVTTLTAAAAAVRRLTEVPDSERGLLPQDGDPFPRRT